MEEALSAEGSQRHPWASQSCCLGKEKAWCHFLPPIHAPLILLGGDTSRLSFPASIEATSLSFKTERDREKGTMREKEDRRDGGREGQKAKVENLPESPVALLRTSPLRQTERCQ